MLKNFQKYIFTKALWRPEDQILIALSSGMDSMVLCDLMLKAKFQFAIAHCNFKLRSTESDQDEAFARNYAKTHKLSFFTTSFDTSLIAKLNQESIQLAARKLRYKWLEQIRKEGNFDYIATAHHLNDSAETLLYNLTKGCGIRGLHGILPKKGLLVRPLLFATKKEIQNYAIKNKIVFREDSSNQSDKYHRNHIRQNVIPQLKIINPSFERTVEKNLERFRDIEAILDYQLDLVRKKVVRTKRAGLELDLEILKSFPAPATLLFELLKPFGFNSDQINQLLFQEHQSGIEYFSTDYRIILNRKNLLLIKNTKFAFPPFEIQQTQKLIEFANFSLKLAELNQKPEYWSQNPNLAYLDKASLNFPLIIRKWVPGDKFQPFGMRGQHKKLKDFLTNLKLSRWEKERVLVLESAGHIVWIIGHRISQSNCINSNTKEILRIEVLSD